jgi:mannose-6-phosphate isomerase-like protein (cupin superfamily)
MTRIQLLLQLAAANPSETWTLGVMPQSSINLSEKLHLFTDLWAPKVIAELNDYQVKLAKLHGEFVWHQHDDTDELFLCISGELKIALHDSVVSLNEGELFVVPKGVEHKPIADEECHVLIIEPKDVINTGDTQSALTAPNNQWI